jgi:hypothetical protein
MNNIFLISWFIKLFKFGSRVLRSMIPRRSYHYERLPTNHHIRLLTIIPGDSPEICAALTVVDEFADPRYQCLSYTWGPPRKSDAGQARFEHSRRFVLDGIEVSIKPNLDDALHHLRRLNICGPIWIDALCIDQEDIGERSQQVSKMDRIYANAYEVIIWLGTELPELASVIHTIQKIGVTSDEIMQVSAADKFVNSLKNKLFDDEELIALFDFSLEFHWFTRIWTVQELALARERRFLCGTTTLKLEDVWAAEMLLVTARGFFSTFLIGYLEGIRQVRESLQLAASRHDIQLPELAVGVDTNDFKHLQSELGMKFYKHSISRMDYMSKHRDWTGHTVFSGFGGISTLLESGFLRAGNNGSNPRKLLSILAQELREKDATDPRDKLYGLLGLTSKSISHLYLVQHSCFDRFQNRWSELLETGAGGVHRGRCLGSNRVSKSILPILHRSTR